MKRRLRTRIAGFTLIEMLMVSALMGAILAALATVTAQWLPNWNRGIVGVQRNEMLGVGYEVRVNWLTGGVEIVPLNLL